jgi:hypothetical protein
MPNWWVGNAVSVFVNLAGSASQSVQESNGLLLCEKQYTTRRRTEVTLLREEGD